MIYKPVCIVTAARTFGGAEIHTIGLIRALQERGHKVDVVNCLSEENDEFIGHLRSLKGINIVHTHLSRWGWQPRSLFEWIAVFLRLESRIVVLPYGDAGPAFNAAVCLVFRKRFILYHMRGKGKLTGLGFAKYKLFLLNLSVKGTLLLATKIVAVSTDIRDYLVAAWGISPTKIAIVYNGVEWYQYQRRPELGHIVRSANLIGEDTFVFGMVCRLSDEKKVDMVLRSLKSLIRYHPSKSIMLLVAGEGPRGPALRALANELGLVDCVRWLGFVRNIGPVLSAIDAIVFSSDTEGLPFALLEAMASGCVPIVTRVGGLPEVVSGPELGWVVSPQSTAHLSEAMESAICLDREQFSRMRSECARRIRVRFDSRSSYTKITDLLSGDTVPEVINNAHIRHLEEG